jgi:hypothetical protein
MSETSDTTPEAPEYIPQWLTQVLKWDSKTLYEAGYVKNEDDWNEFMRNMEREVERWFTN